MDYSFISYHYVSAPAGSGKTHAAIRFAVDRARLGEKVMIAQPSKRCIAEWFEHTRSLCRRLAGDSRFAVSASTATSARRGRSSGPSSSTWRAPVPVAR